MRRLKKMGAKVQLTTNMENAKRKKQEDYIDDVDDLDEQAIREIFLDVGLIKEKDPERERRLEYLGIECERSLYLFSK